MLHLSIVRPVAGEHVSLKCAAVDENTTPVGVGATGGDERVGGHRGVDVDRAPAGVVVVIPTAFGSVVGRHPETENRIDNFFVDRVHDAVAAIQFCHRSEGTVTTQIESVAKRDVVSGRSRALLINHHR